MDGGLEDLKREFPDVDEDVVQGVLAGMGGSVALARQSLRELFEQPGDAFHYDPSDFEEPPVPLQTSEKADSTPVDEIGSPVDDMAVEGDGDGDPAVEASDGFGQSDFDDDDDGFGDDGFDSDGFPDDDGDNEFPGVDLGASGEIYGLGSSMVAADILRSSSGMEFTSLNSDDIWRLQQEALQTVHGILTTLPAYCARVLLTQYQWDANRMLAAFSEDADAVCKKAGIPPPENIEPVEFDPDDRMCGICFDEYEANEFTRVACGHGLCNDCWKDYLGLEVKERKEFILCPCMNGQHKCKMVLDEFDVIRLLNDKEREARLKETMLRSYVDNHPSCKWCPKPGCKNAVLLNQVSGENNEVVECSCSHRFCFRCLGRDHRPISCDMSKEWLKKTSGKDDTLNELAILTIARPCPKCKVPIQKNDGCNHMTCTGCKFHFCWQCMEKFGSGPLGGSDGYSNHRCNGSFKRKEVSASSKDDLARFEFYSKRADNHQRSLVLEKKLLEVIVLFEHKMNDVYAMAWIGCQYYRDAVHRLIQNREALIYSYAFGYFRPTMAPYVNEELFENLQFDLERHSEKLSGLLGSPDLTDEHLEALFNNRSEIANQTKVAESVLKAMLQTASEWDITAYGNTARPKVGPNVWRERRDNSKKKKKGRR